MKHAWNFKNLVGQKFGFWTVLEFFEIRYRPNKTRKSMWLCRCVCGREKVTHSSCLINGESTSCGCQKGLVSGRASSNRVFYQYKKNAKHRGYSWEISRELFDKITSLNCTYCGAPPSQKYRSNARAKGFFTYNGIDRIDNSIGYIPDNITTCCQDCNRAKYDLSVDDFLSWAKRIHDYSKDFIV